MNANRPQRKRLRLESFDYTSAGAYFVTICCYDRSPMFDHPVLREVAQSEWRNLATRFPTVRLDEFVVMPNHIHFVIWLVGAPLAGARNAPSEQNAPARQDETPESGPPRFDVTPSSDAPLRAPARGAPTLGAVVGSYKSLVALKWLQWIKENEPNRLARLWQRNFYERVIRNDDELNRIRQYIRLNPIRWLLDAENPNRQIEEAYDKEWGWLEAQTVVSHPL